MKHKKPALSLLLAIIFISISTHAQNLTEFEKHVTQFTLNNGLRFIVVERHEAPVVSFFTYADVGSVNEVTGMTGMAHMFEHMAFKGTKKIGTRDINKELQAMQTEDDAFERLRKEQDRIPAPDPEKLKQLQKEFEEAKTAAQALANSKEFSEAIDRAGGVEMNASTQTDATEYHYSLPSNKLELWFSLESERFFDPVLREFYVERDVVMEERRLRTESSPTGRLFEEFLAAAYKAHPYGEPTVGFMSDLQSLSRSEAKAFFEKYYEASNLIIAIVGDVDPVQVRRLAGIYFERLPKTPKPDPVETVEPEQPGERRVVIEDRAQPYLLMGYHIGSVLDPNDNAVSVLADIIGRGRASRLYKRLVKEKRIAVNASGFSGVPGLKYPGLFVFVAVPSQGHTTEECENEINAEIDRLQKEPVSAEELKKSKTRARADIIRELDSNTGIAEVLTTYQALTGDWRNLFLDLDKINAVTAEDIQRVAKQYFIPKNRTVAVIKTIQ